MQVSSPPIRSKRTQCKLTAALQAWFNRDIVAWDHWRIKPMDTQTATDHQIRLFMHVVISIDLLCGSSKRCRWTKHVFSMKLCSMNIDWLLVLLSFLFKIIHVALFIIKNIKVLISLHKQRGLFHWVLHNRHVFASSKYAHTDEPEPEKMLGFPGKSPPLRFGELNIELTCYWQMLGYVTWKTRGQQAADVQPSRKTLNAKSTYRVGHFKDIPHAWNSGRHTKECQRIPNRSTEANSNIKQCYSNLLMS